MKCGHGHREWSKLEAVSEYYRGGEEGLRVLERRSTYSVQTVTNAKARFNVALRPQKP